MRLIRPPALGDLQGAVGTCNVASDVDAATNPAVRKASLRVVPNGEVVVNVQAVTNIFTFGNMLARAYPEFVQRVMDLAVAAHAKIAEQQPLTQLGALSTSVTGQAQEGGSLGATRVLLPLLDRAATGMRNRPWADPNAPLQLILPAWARGLLRSDLALQEPGDSTVGVSDADLAAYLATRNLAPTWALDGEAGQEFDAQARGPVNAWPTEVVSYMFPAGAFAFLDGGTLDLGLVRDSTLNAANDFSTFTETFEAAIFRGGGAFRIAQALTPSGVVRAAELAV
ncbi:major capsid protein [Blastococcus sp. SYSU DS1024]